MRPGLLGGFHSKCDTVIFLGGGIKFSSKQSACDALDDSECPESLVLIWAGWEDWCILCHEMVRLMQCLINLLSRALGIEKLK